MNAKQQKTFLALYEDPVQANISWDDVEALLMACGADVTEGRGSRVRVALNGIRAVFHRPHPKKKADKGAVKSVRRFLLEAGVQP